MRRRDLLLSSCMLVGTSLLSRYHHFTNLFAQQTAIPSASEMRPFHINFDRARIQEIHRRIDAMAWPEMPFDTGWSTGTNDRVLRDLVNYWRHGSDWFEEQERLNLLTHLRGPVGGEEMHFVLYRASGVEARFPLLLLHGWPSTFLQFAEAAPLLAQGHGGGPAFDVVVPSLPGFVFSEPPRSPGMHPGRIAQRMHELMRQLGYPRYGVAGNDWGSPIGSDLARAFPGAVVGLHRSGAPWSSPPEGHAATTEERANLAHSQWFEAEELGYSRIQATKPQTLGYALQDSPVGLLAWILEKYWGWSDHGDDLWETFDRDHVLTTVMLYWLTGSVLSSARIYYEREHRPESEMARGPIIVPIAFARFPGDPFGVRRPLVGPDPAFANVVRVNEMPRGGHFPATEVPELWAADVASFFSKL